MKNLLLFIVLLPWAIQSKGQRNYEAFDVLFEKTIVPPNGILVGENLFLDDSEVMNSHYLEYLHFLAQDSSEQALLNAYPDTSIFGSRHLNHLLKLQKKYYKKRGSKHIPISLLIHDEVIHEPGLKHHWWNYFSYHGTKHFPVVGVSYEQALAYSAWRSAFVTHLFNEILKKKNKYKAFQNQFVRFEFYLPDEKLWEAAAQYPQSQTVIIDTTALFNVKTKSGSFKKEPQPAFDHPPTASGFYNLIGNVAEMVAEKGKSKGGSYAQSLEECQPTSSIPYFKPERWLGYRCACKVTNEPLTKK